MTDTATPTATERFRQARDFLLERRTAYAEAQRDFTWPQFDQFNWALDHFDVIARGNDRPALWIVEEDRTEIRRSFAEMSARSNQVANWLRETGIRRGDRVVLMLGNQVELWETILALMKLGAVNIPATTLLAADDLRDRIDRGHARHVVVRSADIGKFDEVLGEYTRVAVGDRVDGWLSYVDADAASSMFEPDEPTQGSDTLLLYFTSGTTATPKLDTVGEVGDHQAAAGSKARKGARRVVAWWGSSSHWVIRTTLSAAAVITCWRRVFASPK